MCNGWLEGMGESLLLSDSAGTGNGMDVHFV